MNDRTVVAWNGRPDTLSALDWAVARESPRNGRVLIVRVVDEALPEAISPDAMSAAEQGARGGVDEQVSRIARAAPSVAITSQVIPGDPRSRLERFSSPASVVVLGHDGSFRHSHLGWSLTTRLIAEARGPLVVVPTGPLPRGTGVVVGVDGSPASLAAASFAADEAERGQASLTLVHAWLEPVAVTIVGDIATDNLPWLESAHRDLLERETDRIRAEHPDLVIHVALEQSAADEALRLHARSAALLVVGARGYGPIHGFLLGSVSASLLKSMPCPVAVAGPGYVAALAAEPLPLTTTAH